MPEVEYIYNENMFNPLFWHVMPLLRDKAIRYIFIEGGSSAGKTYSICQALAMDMYMHEYSSMIFRRQQVDIRDTVYEAFKGVYRHLELTDSVEFQRHLMKCEDGKYFLVFKGMDDPENLKGAEGIQVFYNNEWSQFQEPQFDQQRKRLRGRPNQKFICDWNPISANLWQYKQLIDLDRWAELPLTVDGRAESRLDAEYSFKKINEAGNTVWIKTTYRDNYWIVGRPDGKGGVISNEDGYEGFYDKHTLDDFEKDRIQKPNFHRIYANGERGIMRSGGEFWKQFDETKHVGPVQYDPNTVVHITADENVNPYVTLTCWQLVAKNLRQIKELLCKTPDNNAPKAALQAAKWLRDINYSNVVFVYGDPSGRRRSTTDAASRSFFDIFIDTLQKQGFIVRNMVGKAAPPVAASAAFVNDIYERELGGYSITIGDNCKVSIDDYASVQEEKDGTMAKPKVKGENGVTYEPIGHISDAKRYFITQILKQEFDKYRNKSRYQIIYR